MNKKAGVVIGVIILILLIVIAFLFLKKPSTYSDFQFPSFTRNEFVDKTSSDQQAPVSENPEENDPCDTGYENKPESKVVSEESTTLISGFEQRCDGNYYFTFDYLGPGSDDPESGGGYYSNVNGKLRTFKVDSNTRVRIVGENNIMIPLNQYVSVLELSEGGLYGNSHVYQRFTPNGVIGSFSGIEMVSAIVFDVKIQNGVVVELNEVYIP